MTATDNIGQYSIVEDSNGDLVFVHPNNGQVLKYDESDDTVEVLKDADANGNDVNNVGALQANELSNVTLYVSSSGQSLENALSAASTFGGADVHIVGDYQLTADRVIPANTTLRQEYGVIDQNGYALLVDGENVALKGLTTSVPDTQGGALVDIGSSVAVKGCTVENCSFSAGSAGAAIQINNNSADIIVQDNKITGGFAGVDVSYGSNVSIERNTIEDVGRYSINVFGVSGSPCKNIRICGNTVRGWMEEADFPDGGINAYGPDVQNVVIEGNTIDTTTTAAQGQHQGINLTGVTSATVRDNDILMRSSTCEKAIFAGDRDGDTPQEIVFSDNRIRIESNHDYAYHLVSTDDVTLANNKWSVAESVTFSIAFGESDSAVGPVKLIDETVDYCPANYLRVRGATVAPMVEVRGLDLPDTTAAAVVNEFSDADIVRVTDSRIVSSGSNALVVESNFNNMTIADCYLEATTPIGNEGNGTTTEAINNNIRV